MKRHYINASLFVLLLVSFFSCRKDFLEKAPQSELTTAGFYKTPADAEAGLVAAYDALQQEYYIWDYITNGDTRADNCYAGGDNPNNFQIDNFQVTSTNTNIERDWSQLYNGIMRANTVLDGISQIDSSLFVPAERMQQIIGEAKFLRAMHYFRLVRDWGAVPLVLSANDQDIYKQRSDTATVYAQIESDLKDAEATLPSSYGSAAETRGRATKGSAQALLAKVYAQEKNYQSCLDYCTKVTGSSLYTLLPNFEDLWTGQNENNSESIFEIQYNESGEGDWGIQLITPKSLTGDEWIKFNIPTHDLVDSFRAEGDSVRLHASIIFESSTNVPSPYTTAESVPYIYKWRHPNGWNSPDNVMMMRLADIILLKAEALVNLGQPAEAVPLINQIRTRAKLPAITATEQADVNAAVLKERRLELAFEGERWYDLLRQGTQYTINIMNQQQYNGHDLNYNLTQNELLFPLPQREVTLNNSLTQNPGY
jgi:hypothetical protein